MAHFEEANIDPVKYGQLWEKVQNYERRFDDMGKKIDRMETQLEKLVALANQGRWHHAGVNGRNNLCCCLD